MWTCLAMNLRRFKQHLAYSGHFSEKKRFISCVQTVTHKTSTPSDSNPHMHADNEIVIETPLLLVGAGPVGTTLSMLLGRHHVPHILVDRVSSVDAIASMPSQAHFISNRSMEILRSLGHFDEEVVRQAPPLKDWRNTTYSTSVNINDHWTNLLCVQDHFEALRCNDHVYVDPHSPSTVSHFPQNRLVPLLLKYGFEKLGLVDISQTSLIKTQIRESEVQRYTAPRGHLLLGYEWAGGFAGKLGVESFLKSSTDQPSIICRRDFASLLHKKLRLDQVESTRAYEVEQIEKVLIIRPVGTDGIRSSTRKCLLETEGIRMESFGPTDDMVNVGFLSKQLGQILKEQNPGMLHVVLNGNAVAVLVAYNLDDGIFVAVFPYFEDHQSFERMFNEQKIRIKLNAIAGRNLDDIELLSIRRWKCSTLLASSFRDTTTGRILIGGDAAHTMPPAGGLAMNCGFADAHNLAWKIAHIYHFRKQSYADSECLMGSPIDLKGSRLLESYAAERYYSSHYAMQVAKEYLNVSRQLPAIFGLKYSSLKHLSNCIISAQKYVTMKTKLRFTPIRHIIDKLFHLVFCLGPKLITIQKWIYPLWLYNQYRAEKLTHEQGSLLPLLSWGSDLGYSYRNSPLNPQIQNGIPYLRAPLKPTIYSPPTLLGCRIPHSYILIQQKQKTDSKLHIMSTVDLPLLKFPNCFFCLIIWDRKTLNVLIDQLEQSYGEMCSSSAVLPSSEKEIAAVIRAKLLQNHPVEDVRKELVSFVSKMFVVLWNCPMSGVDVKPNHAKIVLLNQVNATSLAGHVGVNEMQLQFPHIGVNPLRMSDEDLQTLGNEDMEAAEVETEAILKLDNKENSKQKEWWTRYLELRTVWSDVTTLENFKQSIRVERLSEAAVLLRPDSHIATLCSSITNPERIEEFVAETLKLPLG